MRLPLAQTQLSLAQMRLSPSPKPPAGCAPTARLLPIRMVGLHAGGMTACSRCVRSAATSHRTTRPGKSAPREGCQPGCDTLRGRIGRGDALRWPRRFAPCRPATSYHSSGMKSSCGFARCLVREVGKGGNGQTNSRTRALPTALSGLARQHPAPTNGSCRPAPHPVLPGRLLP